MRLKIINIELILNGKKVNSFNNRVKINFKIFKKIFMHRIVWIKHFLFLVKSLSMILLLPCR